MDTNRAKKIAIELMTKYNLIAEGWVFKFDKAKRRFGVVKYLKKEISLSILLTELNDESKVIDTILHEIAHALTPGHGHDKVWKAKAIEIGCTGERCYSSSEVETPDSKYFAICKGCNTKHKRHKKPKRICSCGYCSGGKYNSEYKLEWLTN